MGTNVEPSLQAIYVRVIAELMTEISLSGVDNKISVCSAWKLRSGRWILCNGPAEIRLITNDVIMSAMASQITSLTIVYSNVYSDVDQRKHQSSASLAFTGNSPGTGEFPAQMASTRKMFSFDDVMMDKAYGESGQKEQLKHRELLKLFAANF